MFDKFCKIGQMMRKDQRPFGGIQIIVTGDFFQLPPVTKGGGQPKFSFEAMTWDETIHMSVNLTRVFRQKDQREYYPSVSVVFFLTLSAGFVDMLNEMRFGTLTAASIQAFKKLNRPITYTDNIVATELFPRREDVERANHTRLAQLNTEGYKYAAQDGGAITDLVQREKILSNFMASVLLTIKIGAQVMLIKNTDETLVNGSMGTVIGFCHKQFYDTDAQGKWVHMAMEDLSEEDREKKIKMRALLEAKMSSATPYPVVKFAVPGGGFRDMLVEPEVFKTELPSGETQASRTQVSYTTQSNPRPQADLICSCPSSWHGLCRSTSLKVKVSSSPSIRRSMYQLTDDHSPRQGQSRPRQGFRKGSSVRGAFPSYNP